MTSRTDDAILIVPAFVVDNEPDSEGDLKFEAGEDLTMDEGNFKFELEARTIPPSCFTSEEKEMLKAFYGDPSKPDELDYRFYWEQLWTKDMCDFVEFDFMTPNFETARRKNAQSEP